MHAGERARGPAVPPCACEWGGPTGTIHRHSCMCTPPLAANGTDGRYGRSQASPGRGERCANRCGSAVLAAALLYCASPSVSVLFRSHADRFQDTHTNCVTYPKHYSVAPREVEGCGRVWKGERKTDRGWRESGMHVWVESAIIAVTSKY
jgi:hypothetical protein